MNTSLRRQEHRLCDHVPQAAICQERQKIQMNVSIGSTEVTDSPELFESGAWSAVKKFLSALMNSF